MLTLENYFKEIAKVDKSIFTAELLAEYDFVKEVTEDHTTWKFYEADRDIKNTVDNYLDFLNHTLNTSQKPEDKPESNIKNQTSVNRKVTEVEARAVAEAYIGKLISQGYSYLSLRNSTQRQSTGEIETAIRANKVKVKKVKGINTDYVFPLQQIVNTVIGPALKNKAKAKFSLKNKTAPITKNVPTRAAGRSVAANNVERVDDDVKYIKRYALLHGKEKTDQQILAFINSLHKAILEKRIRKTSLHADKIEYIQKNLIRVYNEMGGKITLQLKEEVLAEYLKIAGSQGVRLSVGYMKRYVGLQGKHIDKEKARKLYQLIETAIKNEKIKNNDPYRIKMRRVLASLRTFIKNAKPTDTLGIHSAVLNGIEEVLDGCAWCEREEKSVDGLAGTSTVMNSIDFMQLHFPTIGMQGKWKLFIGDPPPNFSVMVYGKPKFGKSTLCIDLAGYLAKAHGRVLYVANEETLHKTLQDKLRSMSVSHPRLFVTASLPASLFNYDYIFLDSVNRLGLTVDDLRRLKASYPTKSFIYVFQSTKSGQFRGAQAFQHDVDVVIEVPEWGKATQMGRFNQGGNMHIFDQQQYSAAA